MRWRLDDVPDRFWTPRRASAFVWAQLGLWLALAESLLPTHGHFCYDEAFFYDRSFRVARGGGLAADGPFVSGTTPRAFTPGGGVFDLYAPPFVFARDPRWGTAFVLLLSAAGVLLLDRALARLAASGRMRVAAATLATWSIFHARFSDRIWNVDAFLFAVPLLLWLSARLREAPARLGPWAFGWGAAAALCLQIHLSGAVAVALCALVAAPGLARRGWLAPLGWAAGGGVALYLPWIHAQLPLHCAGLLALRHGGPAGRLFGAGLARSLIVFAKFPSQAARLRPERPPAGAAILSAPWLGFLTFWITAALVPLGLALRSRWRAACLAGLVLAPLYLAASGRDYFDHYLIVGDAFYLLPAAAALGWLAGRGRLGAALVGLYLVGFALLGARLLATEYGGDWRDWTIGEQLEIARHLADRGHPIAPVGPPLATEESFVYETLARDVLQRPLTFAPGGEPCELGDAPRQAKAEWPVGGGKHWLSCGR